MTPEEILLNNVNKELGIKIQNAPSYYSKEESISAMKVYAEQEIKKYKSKADKWDALDEKIGKFYPEDIDGEPDEGGDLCDIGEVAAMAFGYL